MKQGPAQVHNTGTELGSGWARGRDSWGLSWPAELVDS